MKSGDQLLKVNGKSLIGVTQDRAAELIAQSGSTVHLEVMKQGAVAHGIATLLESPSPPLSGKLVFRPIFGYSHLRRLGTMRLTMCSSASLSPVFTVSFFS